MDNQDGWITAFVERLKEEHAEHFVDGDEPKELTVFFDKDEIRSGHNWRHKLLESVQNSCLFIAFVSPNYFASEWCRKEWRTWVEAEIGKHILSEGAHPIYIIEVPWLYEEMDEQQVAGELEKLSLDPGLAAEANNLAAQLRARQSNAQVQLFYEQGQEALREEKLIAILKELTDDLETRAQRVRDAENSFSSVPSYNANFTGRLTELNQLRESLDDRNTGVITSIHGLGGIGKTELAYTYAHAFASIYPGGRYLIKCDGFDNLAQPVINSLGPYFNKYLSEQDQMEPKRHFPALIAQLRKQTQEKGRTLLLLDNVSKEDILATSQTDLLTDPQGNIHMLATTRLGQFSIKNPKAQWLTLGSLPEKDALDLLSKYRPIDFTAEPEEDAAAQKLVQLIGGFTLVVELVGAYLQKTENSYIEALQWFQDDLSQTTEDIGKDATSLRHDHEKSLSIILNFSLQRLQPAALTALNYAVHLPADSIVLPWLRELIRNHYPELPDHSSPTQNESWYSTLNQLHSLALLNPNDGEDADPRIQVCIDS